MDHFGLHRFPFSLSDSLYEVESEVCGAKIIHCGAFDPETILILRVSGKWLNWRVIRRICEITLLFAHPSGKPLTEREAGLSRAGWHWHLHWMGKVNVYFPILFHFFLPHAFTTCIVHVNTITHWCRHARTASCDALMAQGLLPVSGTSTYPQSNQRCLFVPN